MQTRFELRLKSLTVHVDSEHITVGFGEDASVKFTVRDAVRVIKFLLAKMAEQKQIEQ